MRWKGFREKVVIWLGVRKRVQIWRDGFCFPTSTMVNHPNMDEYHIKSTSLNSSWGLFSYIHHGGCRKTSPKSNSMM